MGGDDHEKMHFVVVGPGGVGKSAITLSFVRNQFMEEYDPTIEDSYTKELVVDDVTVELDITDTAGQEEFRGLWGDKHISSGDGFIVVYSVIDANTLADLEQFKTQIHRVKDQNKVPMVICANKCDLKDEREVSKEEGDKFAQNANAIHVETSAKTGLHVEDAFLALIREVRASRKRKADAAAAKEATAGGKPAANGKAGGKAEKKKGGCTIL
eukprot:comp12438_c0_seq1/m.7354 comp12438_c0_seq1/g.7354  ORF comp12438_c0_seq1/g.7354 comp12438_c0_seq1/m.7354 type:complete len:213 (-) comp12438_c0_seq1:363-1001(-)